MRKVVHESNIGRIVLCDLCNGDYTDSDETGGFVFGSKAVCPECAPSIEEAAVKYDEMHYITKPKDTNMSFGDFVRDYRGGDGHVIIETFDSVEDLFDGSSN